jgi:chromosome segregation ATPase
MSNPKAPPPAAVIDILEQNVEVGMYVNSLKTRIDELELELQMQKEAFKKSEEKAEQLNVLAKDCLDKMSTFRADEIAAEEKAMKAIKTAEKAKKEAEEAKKEAKKAMKEAEEKAKKDHEVATYKQIISVMERNIAKLQGGCDACKHGMSTDEEL